MKGSNTIRAANALLGIKKGEHYSFVFRQMVCEYLGMMFLMFTSIVLIYGEGEHLNKYYVMVNGIVLAVIYESFIRVQCGFVNPAHVIGMFTAGKFTTVKTLLLIIAQFLGAIHGVYIISRITSLHLFQTDCARFWLVKPKSNLPLFETLFIEACGSFGIVFTMINIRDLHQIGWTSGGIGIGFVTTAFAIALQKMTGGVLNPAKYNAVTLFYDDSSKQRRLAYYLGPLFGGAVAGLAHRVQQISLGDENIVIPFVKYYKKITATKKPAEEGAGDSVKIEKADSPTPTKKVFKKVENGLKKNNENLKSNNCRKTNRKSRAIRRPFKTTPALERSKSVELIYVHTKLSHLENYDPWYELPEKRSRSLEPNHKIHFCPRNLVCSIV